jgi:uncharacterized protein (DUF1778 family)
MARPNENRTEQVIGLVTPEEKQAVKTAAEKQDETVSDYVRLAVLSRLNGQAPPPASTTENAS